MQVFNFIILVLAGRFNFQEAYDSTRCGVAIVFDDFINGNETQDKENFFIGLEPLKVMLNDLNGDMSEVEDTVEPVSTSGEVTSRVLANIDEEKVKCSEIPDGTENGSLTLSYKSPIIEESPSDTTDSLFPSTLGSSAENNTLVGKAYVGLETAETSINAVAVAADALEETTQAFSDGLQAAIDEIDTLTTDVYDINADLNTDFHNIQ